MIRSQPFQTFLIRLTFFPFFAIKLGQSIVIVLFCQLRYKVRVHNSKNQKTKFGRIDFGWPLGLTEWSTIKNVQCWITIWSDSMFLGLQAAVQKLRSNDCSTAKSRVRQNIIYFLFSKEGERELFANAPGRFFTRVTSRRFRPRKLVRSVTKCFVQSSVR